jgi:hypothetical protein
MGMGMGMGMATADESDAEMAIEYFMNHPDGSTAAGPARAGARAALPTTGGRPPVEGSSDNPQLTTPGLQLSRLIRDGKGKFMFIGDSANLSLLQNIRRIAEASIGPCAFVSDPLRCLMVEDTPEDQDHWLDAQSRHVVPKPTLQEAAELIRQYIRATNCVLDLFDEAELLEQLPSWLNDDANTFGPAIYHLVLAIGAQTSPAQDQDGLAKSHFDHGRYLTMLRHMDDPSVVTVQAYALITMYMLGASRRNAAFMNLGIGVRAAYALGLHQREVSELFTSNEYKTRERLWKVIRVLDLFMSSSLGRTPSTSETRDSNRQDNYSASASLCAVFEHILTEIYRKRMVSTEVVETISDELRRWTTRLSEGLEVDHIAPTDALASGTLPNVGLFHLKEAYYWTIILLTRPFLVDYVSSYVTRQSGVSTPSDTPTDPPTPPIPNETLVNACVDSAVRTIELLQGLFAFARIPKRLPFVVNSIFVSALVAGVAFFGDLDRSFPLLRTLEEARSMLRRFRRHDALAQRNLAIIDHLDEACRAYIDKRDRRRMEGHRRMVGGIFGSLHQVTTTTTTTPQHLVDTTTRKTQQPGPERRPHPTGDPSMHDFELDNSATNLPATGIYGTPFASDSSIHSQSNNDHSSTLWDAAAPDNNNLEYPRDNSHHHLHHGLDATYKDNPNDHGLPFAPQTLWFDSYEDSIPLFSTFHADGLRG